MVLLGKENNSAKIKINTMDRLVSAKHLSWRRKLRLGEVVSFAKHHRQLVAE